MKVEKAEKGAAKDNRLWLMILAALGAVIVILVVVIVIVVVNKNAAVNPEFGGSIEEAEEIYQEYADKIEKRLSNWPMATAEQVLGVYNDYMHSIDNKKAQALLWADYYQVVMLNDVNKEKKDEVLNKMIELDGILGTVNSAVFVLNAASYYDDTTLYNHYDKVLTERELGEGIDLEMKTDG